MSNNSKFIKAAQLKTSTVEVLGEKLLVRELKAVDRLRYADLVKEDNTKEGAIAFLIELGVVNEDGTSRFSKEEAAQIASGSGRVAFKIINAVMQPEGDDEVKKDLTLSEGSSLS